MMSSSGKGDKRINIIKMRYTRYPVSWGHRGQSVSVLFEAVAVGGQPMNEDRVTMDDVIYNRSDAASIWLILDE